MKIEHIIVIAVILIILLIIVNNNNENLNRPCPKKCRNTNECCYGFHCRKGNCIKVCNINGEPCRRPRDCCKKFNCKNKVCV